MFCVDVVRHEQPVHESLVDQLHDVLNALSVGYHVHGGVKLIVGGLCAEEIVLQVTAQLGKLQQLIHVENCACKWGKINPNCTAEIRLLLTIQMRHDTFVGPPTGLEIEPHDFEGCLGDTVRMQRDATAEHLLDFTGGQQSVSLELCKVKGGSAGV